MYLIPILIFLNQTNILFVTKERTDFSDSVLRRITREAAKVWRMHVRWFIFVLHFTLFTLSHFLIRLIDSSSPVNDIKEFKFTFKKFAITLK